MTRTPGGSRKTSNLKAFANAVLRLSRNSEIRPRVMSSHFTRKAEGRNAQQQAVVCHCHMPSRGDFHGSLLVKRPCVIVNQQMPKDG